MSQLTRAELGKGLSDMTEAAFTVEAKLAKAREALRFYANRQTYEPDSWMSEVIRTQPISKDQHGNRARQILKEIGDE